jgi:single-strand DNA-binding protein
MASVNKAIIVGNVGKVESRQIPSGIVTNLSVATNSSYQDKTTGQQVKKTEWHNCVAFGKLAEICAQYLKAGSQVYIEGSIETTKDERDGVVKYYTKIKMASMQMLGSRDAAPAQSVGTPYPAAEDDDIPF